MSKKVLEILSFLDYLFPDPKCELEAENDYQFLIAIMLSAQTTDKRVNKVTKVLFSKYKSLEELKNADINDIYNIVRELGNFTKKGQAIIEIARILVDEYDGVVPVKRDILETFPMVGRKTVSVFLSEWYDIPNFAVDTHVLRCSNRLGLSNSNNVLVVEKDLKRKIPKNKWNRVNQQLVLFGRYFCMARGSRCIECKLRGICEKKD